MILLWEKEEMLVTSIFSISKNAFYHSQNKFKFFSRIYFVKLDQTDNHQVMSLTRSPLSHPVGFSSLGIIKTQNGVVKGQLDLEEVSDMTDYTLYKDNQGANS